MPLVAPLCWSCRAPAKPGLALCGSCRGRLRFVAEAGGIAPAGAPGIAPAAGPGIASARSPLRIHAAVFHDGPARDLVLALKFRAATGLADQLAAFMVAAAPEGLLAGGGALVPVPLHPRRRRRRGFNQAELLARALARRTGLDVLNCLERSGSDLRQVGRGRQARLGGPAGAFAARCAVPARAVLVDDVATTGATLSACARVLRAGGAKQLEALVFARTPGR